MLLDKFETSGLRITNGDGDLTNNAVWLDGTSADTIAHWPHRDSKFISLFPSKQFEYINGGIRINPDLLPNGTIIETKYKDPLFSNAKEEIIKTIAEGLGKYTKPEASWGYYDVINQMFYPNPKYQYKHRQGGQINYNKLRK